MTDEEHAGWAALNDRVTGGGRTTTPCADCPISFALAMRAVGRCDGEPGEDRPRPRG